MMRSIGWVVVVMVAALSCVRCGQPICAFGAGDCEKMYAGAPGSTSTNNTQNVFAVAVTPPVGPYGAGDNIQLAPANATACANGSYNFQITPNDGSVVNLQNVFTPSNGGTTYTINITDCGKPAKTGKTTIQTR